MTNTQEHFNFFPAIFLFLFLMTFTTLAHGTTPISVKTIEPNLYMMNGLGYDVNVTFLVTEEGVVVIDAGNNFNEGKTIVNKIKEITNKPIKCVILTHYHSDHYYGITGFPQGTPIIAQENCAARINPTSPFFKFFMEKILPEQIKQTQQKFESLKQSNSPELKQAESELKEMLDTREALDKLVSMNIKATTTFDKKYDMTVGKEKIELLFPGPTHTDGNIIVYLPGRKVAIMGDLFFNGTFPYIDFDAGCNTARWIECLYELQKMEINKVIPGHGPIATKETLKTQAEFLTDLRKAVKDALDKGLTLDEMKKTIMLEKYKNYRMPFFRENNIESVYQEMTPAKK